MTDFIVLGSNITVDTNCSHEIKRCLLLGRKGMTNLDSILKSRDTTLPIKIHIVKAMVFPVVMYGCESWTIKEAGSWRIDAFELWCWRRQWHPTPVLLPGKSHEWRSLVGCSPWGHKESRLSNTLSSLVAFMVQLSHPYMTTGKTTALTRQTFVGKCCLCFLICCLDCS